VRALLHDAGRAPSGKPHGHAGWARAAGLVLFLATAGALAAMPRSPLRRWARAITHPAPPAMTPAVTGPEPTGPTAAAETTGVRLNVAAGPVRVALQGVADGTEVEVRWVAGSEAAIYAVVGSHFTSAAGRLEARPAPGPVRIELPRSAMPATVEVEGRTWLSRTATGLSVAGPVVRRDADVVVFRAGGAPR
jgi:hypothetical protein